MYKSRVLNYLELVHSFYKNYMSTGSNYRIPLAAATVNDFLHLISQTIKVDCEVLRPIEENIHQLIIHCYMDRYLERYFKFKYKFLHILRAKDVLNVIAT